MVMIGDRYYFKISTPGFLQQPGRAGGAITQIGMQVQIRLMQLGARRRIRPVAIQAGSDYWSVMNCCQRYFLLWKSLYSISTCLLATHGTRVGRNAQGENKIEKFTLGLYTPFGHGILGRVDANSAFYV
jgi:hypothetical protein